MATDPFQIWLNAVKISRSGSKSTQSLYKRVMTDFLAFTGTSAQAIEEEFSNCETLKSERNFKKKYTDAVNSYVAHLQSRGMTRNSQSTSIGVVKSFFKYRELPLNFGILKVSTAVQYPDRDITKNELLAILEASKPRERAFYTIIAQSGLRPKSVCGLRLKDLEPSFSEETVPCMIRISESNTKGAYGSFVTFIGIESVLSLKAYIARERPNIQSNDLIFAQQGADRLVRDRNNKLLQVASIRKGLPASPASFGRLFNLTLRALLKSGKIAFEARFDKPSELKLYSLRKYFRKHAGNAGPDYVNYWMGHLSSLGTDLHYLTRDVKAHKDVYAEKAMPFLKLETPLEAIAIGEMDAKIDVLAKDNEVLNNHVLELQSVVESLQRTRDIQAFQLTKMQNPTDEEIKLKTSKQLLEAQGINFDEFVSTVVKTLSQTKKPET